MLVDHLIDSVFQQHDKLVERFDLPLQLDSVDKVNRHRNTFFSQGVQERLLKRLPFRHFLYPTGMCLIANQLAYRNRRGKRLIGRFVNRRRQLWPAKQLLSTHSVLLPPAWEI